MVSRGKSRDRIEPSFEDEREDEDFRLDADDRVVGGRPVRTGAKKAASSAKRGKSGGQKKSKAKSRGGGFGLGRLIYWGFVLSIWCGIGLVGLIAYYGSQMPSASSWSIPERPPKEALDQRRREATRAFTEQTSGDHIRGGRKARPRKSVGYRPKRDGR